MINVYGHVSRRIVGIVDTPKLGGSVYTTNWSEAPIMNAIPNFPFLEGSRAIVGSRQLQARFGLI